MLKYHIPASITLAQGVLESGAGKSELATRANNHFGIKCNGWTGRKSYHDDDEMNECFRAYDNVYESYRDHSVFLTTSKRYSSLFELKLTDYKGWAKGLKACGYATSPTYANKLIEIIQLYKLYQYDTAKDYDKFQTQQVKSGDNRQIYAFNKNYYLKARRGDTFRSIAQEVGISYRKLAKYNERDKNDVLEEGEIVWLKKKQNKAPKNYKGRLHYVKNGESMYSISQLYGIKLKKLYKLNDLPPTYQIRVGDALRLR
jgi:LysM repeat protein